MAASWNLPDYAFVETPHPIANLTDAELAELAPELRRAIWEGEVELVVAHALAVTDGAGHFRIDYSAADFQKTIYFMTLLFTTASTVTFRYAPPTVEVIKGDKRERAIVG